MRWTKRARKGMVETWYSLEDLPHVKSLKLWAYWSINGVPHKLLVEHVPVRGEWYWMRQVKGRFQLLPPRGQDGHGWADQPICWRPCDVDDFYWPIGEPKKLEPHMIPIMASVAWSSLSVDEAMEQDETRDKPVDDRAIQWWRDVSQVEYRSPGEVTRQMAEARLMRALTLDQIIRLDVAPYRSNAAVLANLKASLLDVLEQAPEDDWLPRLDPQPQDHADYLTAMSWLCRISMSYPRWRALQGRRMSPPKSWVQIGFEIGRTPSRARQVYVDMIDRVHAASNVAPANVAPEIAALRERNRAFRSAT